MIWTTVSGQSVAMTCNKHIEMISLYTDIEMMDKETNFMCKKFNGWRKEWCLRNIFSYISSWYTIPSFTDPDAAAHTGWPYNLLFVDPTGLIPWWRHVIGTLYTFLALCEGNPPVTGGFPSQRASNVELLCLVWCHPEQAIKQTSEMPVIWDMMLMWHHSNIQAGNKPL